MDDGGPAAPRRWVAVALLWRDFGDQATCVAELSKGSAVEAPCANLTEASRTRSSHASEGRGAGRQKTEDPVLVRIYISVRPARKNLLDQFLSGALRE
jgi:hypothetical protein